MEKESKSNNSNSKENSGLCGIWQMLEYLIYGEVQPRIVDDIMMLFFIPFIYISERD